MTAHSMVPPDVRRTVDGRVLFDVTGLLQWYAYFRHPSGVQRVTEKLLESMRQHPEMEFVARVLGSEKFYRVDGKILGDLNCPARRRDAIAMLRAIFAQSMRLASLRDLRRDARLFHLPYIILGLSRLEGCFEARLKRGFPRLRGPLQVIEQPNANDVLFNPGDFWCHDSYVDTVVNLKRTTGLCVVQMIHDVFAIDHLEWTHPGFGRVIVNQLQRLAPHVDRWLTNSQFVSSALEGYLEARSIQRRPITVLPMGWDSFGPADAHDPAQDRAILGKYGVAGLPYILHVGTVEPRKNLVTLFDALKQLRLKYGARVPQCVLVGRDGWRSEDVRRRLKSTGDEEGTVHWLRDIPDAELPAFYRSARFTVVPSHGEGWGLPARESLMYGTPCIASRVGGLPEAGSDALVYFDPARPDDLARAIWDWVSDDKRVLEARAHIRRHLDVNVPPSWDASGDALMAELTRARRRSD